jgi:peptide/nickel transport system permease protein
MPMREYAIRRILLAVPTILLVMLAIFAIIRAVPGDIVKLMVAEQQYAANEDELRKELGLDAPVPQQFVEYIGGILKGDLGRSLWTKRSVTHELRNRLPVSFELGFYAILIGLVISLPIGVLSAIRQDTWADYVGRSFAILGISMPNFYLATIVVVFPVIWFHWAPPLLYKTWGEGSGAHLYFFLFPALILGIGLAGGVMRMTRTMMLEVLRQDYIRTAWSKGLRERSIITRHALKNALIPVVTIIGLQVGLAVSGTVIIESIFNMPGIGRFFYEAVYNRDYPAVQGVVLVIAIVVVATNILVDLTYAYLDPRIRFR